MKEYRLNQNDRDFKCLRTGTMKEEDYVTAHIGLVIPCHDIFIGYNGGILLVVREKEPAKGFAWPIGGRVRRGISIEESIRLRVKEECNLRLGKITELGYARFLFNAEPYGHGHGTDNITFVYFAKGFGNLKLDNLHSRPQIVLKGGFKEFKRHAPPYVREFMRDAMEYL